MVELKSRTDEGFESSCRHTLNTVTVNAQVAVFPPTSVAVQVTVVVPTGNVEPLAGEHNVLTPGQLSDAAGAGKATTLVVVAGHVAVATAVMLAGHVMTGGCVSFTVTVKEQLAVKPETSVAVQVTVVVPTGNVVSLCGEHARPTTPQLSEAVGEA